MNANTSDAAYNELHRPARLRDAAARAELEGQNAGFWELMPRGVHLRGARGLSAAPFISEARDGESFTGSRRPLGSCSKMPSALDEALGSGESHHAIGKARALLSPAGARRPPR